MDVTRDFGRPSSRMIAPAVGVIPRRAQAAIVALVLALAVTASPGLFTGGDTSSHTYVLDAGAILPAGARVLQSLPFIDSVIVTSADPIPGAASVDADVRPQALLAEPVGDLTLDSGVASTGAPAVWQTGERGRQAVVALIDTGVAPVPALQDSVAGEIDFTGTGGGDRFGHGTFMASVIAGRGTIAPGVAPEAGILSLKVGQDDGATTLGTVLAAMQWLHGPGQRAGIRVAALAMAVDPGTQAARVLDRATDRLAQRGILVVTAAGNDGPDALTSPATAPRSFSVGAVDDLGTADRGDDVAADFSSTGPDSAGVAQPDIVASGVSVVGSLPAGSVIAGQAADAGHGLYRGSGTSMATAVTAGVAALASSARPDLDGQALDAALRAGGGVLDAPATHGAALAAAEGRDRGNDHDNDRDNDRGNGRGNGRGDGNADPQSIRWTSIRWTSIRWTGTAWGDHQWSMAAWGSIRWTGRAWQYADAHPQSIRWTSIRWTWRS